MNYPLTEEILRFQKLAGISTPFQNPILRDLLLETYIELYCLENNVLQENLNEGLLDKLKKAAEKFRVKPMVPIAASFLSRLKQMLTPEGYEKVIKIIKGYEGSKNPEDIKKYIDSKLNPKSVNEALPFDLFRNKKTGETNTISKIILILILLSLSSASIFNMAQTNADNVPPIDSESIETVSDSIGLDSGETTLLPPEGGEDSDGDTKNIGGNSVAFTDNSTTVGYDTGDYEIKDVDGIVKSIGGEILKQLDGKKFDSNSKIKIKGKISNTPGNEDDNPIGPSKTGLADLRLKAGLDIVDSLVDYLTSESPDQFPDKEALKNSFVDGGTNISDTGPEVSKNSPEAQKNQVTEFDFTDLKGVPIPSDSSDSSDSDSVPFDDPLIYFRRDEVLQPDGNKYYIILGYLLPLITNNKQPSKEFMKILDIKEGDVINDRFINNKLNDDKVKKEKEVVQILKWAQQVKKNPKSIGEFFNSLDSNINIPWRKRILTRPGERGRAAFSGRATSQTPIPGDVSEIKLFNIYENLLLEASIPTWKALPDYDESATKNNLGELVLLYVYTWNVGDNGAVWYVTGQKADGTINRNNPYRESVARFERKYPVLWEKTTDDLVYLNPQSNNQGKPSTDSSEPRVTTMDSNSTKNTPETNKTIETINKNKTLKAALKNINTVDEFKELILIYIENLPYFNDKDKALKNILNKVKGRVQPRDEKGRFIKIVEKIIQQRSTLLEASKSPDVIRSEKIIKTYQTLQSILPKINTEEEVIQLIIRSIIPYLNPDLKGNVNYLKRAIEKAQAELGNKTNLKETFIKVLKEYKKEKETQQLRLKKNNKKSYLTNNPLLEEEGKLKLPSTYTPDRDKEYKKVLQRQIQDYIEGGSKGNLILLDNIPITSLPDTLTKVGRNLYLSSTPITSLPDNLKVGGSLSLHNTPITSLPNNLEVGNSLILRNTPLSEKYTKEEIRKMIEEKGGSVGGDIHF